MTADEKRKKNPTAWVESPCKKRCENFIKKFNKKPENLRAGKKMTMTDLITISTDEYMTKHGG